MVKHNVDQRRETNIGFIIPQEPITIPSIDIINIDEDDPIIIPLKRGRGRPRKYPIKASILKQPKKLGFRYPVNPIHPIPDLLELIKKPGTASVWGNIVKSIRVHKFRRYHQGEVIKRETMESGYLSSAESDSTSATESDHSSIATTGSRLESDSNTEEKELPWLSRVVIPGPIPDLEALLKDPCILGCRDFFSDIDLELIY